VIDEPKAEAPASQFLSFLIGREECAVDLLQVREIVRYVSATRVPRVAACVRGVVNLRGDVVPVIDVAVGLGMPAAPVTVQTCLAVVEVMVGGEKTVVGLITDAVIQLFDLRPDDIEPAPSFGTQVPAAFLLGAAREDGRLVLLLNLDRLLGEGGFLHGLEAGQRAPMLRSGDTA
jgi:purine-binding chemotaxis protein CheW